MNIYEIFDIGYLQELQDAFSDATGVSSLITSPDGNPLTRPSNFRVLCKEIIRDTPCGLTKCKISDAELGKQNLQGPIVKHCLSGGLLSAGVSISVEGEHLANWIIGQVRTDGLDIEKMLDYADEIGADRDRYRKALMKIPVMKEKQFKSIANMLFIFVNQLTTKEHSNLLLREIQTKFEKNAEKLALEQVLINALMEKHPDHIYFKDLESRFIRSSRSQIKRFGFTDNFQVIGKTDFDFFSEEHARQAFNDEQEIIHKGITISKEERETWPDKDDTWVSTTKAPLLNSKGEIIGTFGISRDITQKKKYDKLIKKQNKQLKKINAQKDKLFSIIAHDLRSPFNSFLGLTEVLEKEIHILTNEQVLELVRNLKNSASRLYILLTNLLEWSKMQRGLIKPNFESFPIFDVFDLCFMVTSDTASQKNIKIENRVPVGLNVKADKNMIQIVIHNLLTNALKFTPRGGSVSAFASKTGKNSISVTLTDNGIGMSPKLLEDAFSIDKKNSRPGTDNEPSSGLGLTICKEFIEKNGGRIMVKSEEGKGTSFTFTLPAAD
ncbi:MAG: PocR ligand-binding domain-containing protein [Prolixibacteraceae bacterium]|nr:PocR ligand-binding domain-containing protein [Prolixibacteraceae bacterium]